MSELSIYILFIYAFAITALNMILLYWWIYEIYTHLKGWVDLALASFIAQNHFITSQCKNRKKCFPYKVRMQLRCRTRIHTLQSSSFIIVSWHYRQYIITFSYHIWAKSWRAMCNTANTEEEVFKIQAIYNYPFDIIHGKRRRKRSISYLLEIHKGLEWILFHCWKVHYICLSFLCFS